MAWNYNDGDGEEKVTVYDLRQTYAKIVSQLLLDIYLSKKGQNFIQLFEDLENLEDIIEQKLKMPEIEKYRELLKETREHISLHQGAYTGKDKSPSEVYHIKVILRRMEKFLYRLMEKHKMFGAKEEAELI